ncbi:hypothetical protein ACIN5180_1155 [Acinetobacter baumannii OIFC180]|nr:hypothetical protein ACIN5180_1155 [Acinetobacter baumannii OIFC180]
MILVSSKEIRTATVAELNANAANKRASISGGVMNSNLSINLSTNRSGNSVLL